MSFDEQPDGDIHGECAAEIHRLEAQRDKLLAALKTADEMLDLEGYEADGATRSEMRSIISDVEAAK